MSGEPVSVKSGTPLYRWNIWTDDPRLSHPFPQPGYKTVLSPSIPVPLNVLEGCMEWLRKNKATFFVEWLDAS